jgi:hypothetical protein
MKRYIYLLAAIFMASNLLGQRFVFENIGVPISEKDSLQIENMIRYQMDFYNRIFPVNFAHIKLNVFDDLEEYIAARKNNKPVEIGTMSGFFSPKDSICYVYRPQKRRNEHLPLIYHEISHYFTHLLMQAERAPNWLGEGLSEYFRHFEIKRNKPDHYLSSNTKGRIKTLIKQKNIDLRNFITFNYNSFSKRQHVDKNDIYVLAHGMVYFLIEKDFEQFKAMVLEIKNGNSSFDAINAIYPGGFARFEADFMVYFGK